MVLDSALLARAADAMVSEDMYRRPAGVPLEEYDLAERGCVCVCKCVRYWGGSNPGGNGDLGSESNKSHRDGIQWEREPLRLGQFGKPQVRVLV